MLFFLYIFRTPGMSNKHALIGLAAVWGTVLTGMYFSGTDKYHLTTMSANPQYTISKKWFFRKFRLDEPEITIYGIREMSVEIATPKSLDAKDQLFAPTIKVKI